MKRLTKEEFQDRLQAIQRAMRIFSHMTDNDMTRAFTAYQEILAEVDRPIQVPLKSTLGFTGSAFDEFTKPICPDCNSPMNIRLLPPNNGTNVMSQLVCSNNSCDVVYDSSLDMAGWFEELKNGSNKTE
jgi:hypothetical protein